MEYRVFLSFCLLFIVIAFILDRPSDIFYGLGRILTHRGLLTTDYMAVGGFGAAVVNSAIAGVYGVAVLYFMGAAPSGAALMSLWMTVGWTYLGANVLNILPLTCGVWLYSRYRKAPFSNYVVSALLCHTIAPITSLFYFSNPVMLHLGAQWPLAVNILIGAAAGLLIGFILPGVLAGMLRVHGGFTLYNMGVAGGMIAMFTAACFSGAGIDVPAESMWYMGRQTEIAVFLYVVFAALILAGFIAGRGGKTPHMKNYKEMLARSGHVSNDFYSFFGCTAYINMGLLGLLGTTWALVLGGALNAATFACIFSMAAFGCLGKHIRNVLPLLAGATLCAFLSAAGITDPENILAILFSTCLAPIAGKYGVMPGLAAGFLHVLIATHVGPLTSGLNLYNNGFASGFVAMVLPPVITALKKTPAQD